jgi:hypothetical protein
MTKLSLFRNFAIAPKVVFLRSYCEPAVTCCDVGNAVRGQDSSGRIVAAVGLLATCQAVQKQVKFCRGMARSVTALGKFANGLKN